MTTEITRALSEFNTARRKLLQQSGNEAEGAYAQTYARLVYAQAYARLAKLGPYPQLRKKYRH